MVDKRKILDAWIMAEMLESGDVKSSNLSKFEAEEYQKMGYYQLLLSRISKCRSWSKNNKVVIYFDIFDFSKVLDGLRKEYRFKKINPEVLSGEKVGFILKFQENNQCFKLLGNELFISSSYYLKNKGKVPDVEEFIKFEREFKEYIRKVFSSENIIGFNHKIEAIRKYYGIELSNCYFKLLRNGEQDEVKLNSFYLRDLRWAKERNSENLDSYLGLRVDKNQVNLEIRKNKPDYNPAVFEQILAPHNYPLGRFPSNTKYALSLMQQVVVNLTSNVDTKNIRSVNGPPGTGKTTLLKDVFADLVVKQAMKMSETALLSGKLGGNMGELAELPNGIARNNIVVASSNNGALENIVNELPLEAEIDGTLITELKKVDYFMEIANEIARDSGSNPSKWGLFSLAGGKYSNVKTLIEALKKMLFYLESEYQPNFNVYKEYRELHHSVELLRNEVDAKANEYRNLPVNIQKLNMLAQKYEAFEEKFENEEAQKRYLVQKKEVDYRLLESQNKHKQAKLQLELLNLDSKITLNRETLNKITEQKPWFFEIRKKRFYKNNLKACRHTLKQLEAQKVSLKMDYQYLASLTTEAKMEFEQKQVEYNQWKKLAKDRQDRLLREKSLQENKVETIKRGINTLRPLDLKVGYQQLQLMDPWFTEKYRRAQSRLFIHALGVRKQFLYENRVQLRKAVKVWKNQNKYRLDSPKLINNAWNWINLAIPVISSTFASFGSMFRNVDANTIGNLFIDEAGQATPQSAVGAILRSKRIMAVGDPEQIKPVITLDPLVLNMLKIRFDLPEKYMTEDSSVQTLMDSASHYGFSKDNDTWIGIPLRVHRRCAYPMFTIANDISYDGLMI